MGHTAGQVSDKISQLRGRISVFSTLRDQIRINYLPSDGGAAELRMTRADGMPVTTEHFQAALEDIDEKLEQLEEELQQWEGIVFGAVDSKDAEQDDDEDEEAPVVPLKNTKEKTRANPKARRANQHHATPK